MFQSGGGGGRGRAHLVQPHGHRADERLDARRALVVRRAESPPDVLVVQHLHLEREVLLEVLQDHHEEGELDAQGLAGVRRARDERGGDVGAHDLEHGGLDVLVRDALDVPVAHLFIPYLQWLRPAAGSHQLFVVNSSAVHEHGHARTRRDAGALIQGKVQ